MKQTVLSMQSDHESMVLFSDVHEVLSLTKSFSPFGFSDSPKSHRVPHSRSTSASTLRFQDAGLADPNKIVFLASSPRHISSTRLAIVPQKKRMGISKRETSKTSASKKHLNCHAELTKLPRHETFPILINSLVPESNCPDPLATWDLVQILSRGPSSNFKACSSELKLASRWKLGNPTYASSTLPFSSTQLHGKLIATSGFVRDVIGD